MFTESAGATVTGLRHNTEYGFQVRAQTEHGWGEFSRPLYTTAGRSTDSGEHGWGEFSRPLYTTAGRSTDSGEHGWGGVQPVPVHHRRPDHRLR